MFQAWESKYDGPYDCKSFAMCRVVMLHRADDDFRTTVDLLSNVVLLLL